MKPPRAHAIRNPSIREETYEENFGDNREDGAGVDEICAFEMTAIVDDPELYAVFLKYCGKD